MYLSIGKEVVQSNSSVREQNFSLEISVDSDKEKQNYLYQWTVC